MSDDELLAAEYVLGTLEEPERSRLAAAEADSVIGRAIAQWQRFLAPLIGAGPVPVPAHVWRNIEARL